MKNKECEMCGMSADIELKDGFYCVRCVNECLEESEQNKNKLKTVEKEINNVKYFGLCQSTERILFNLVHDICVAMEIEEDGLGDKYIE